jgi:E3 ubiquitin-protein ligase RNF5
VTRCGHLFCWECLDHWLHSATGAPECPVCKGRVDERIAGDIIPLYGKGKAAANKPRNAAPPAETTAAATGTTAATAAAATESATVDPGLEAFFSRPSAYSFAPGRDARRAAAAAPQQATHAQTHAHEEHHPRPSADRAPPRPRPQQQHQNVQMHMHTHGMPLTVGSSVFFFGGGGGMLLSIVLIIAWAIFNYAPWREWRADLTRWYRRVRGDPAPEEHRDGAAPTTNTAASSSARNENTPSSAASSGTTNETNGLPSQQEMARNLIFSLLAVFVLFQLLLFM